MKILYFSIFFSLFSFQCFAQNPCGDGKIIINGNEVDAVSFDNNNKQGLSLPIWLTSNSTVAAGNRVQLISIIEFNKEPQPGGGNTLVFNDVLEVGTTQQQVPNGKVWKIEGIIKHADPFIAGLSASANAPICFDDNLNLMSSVSGATYSWTGPGGFTSSNQNPTINNADNTNAGMYYLTATHNGCSYTDSVNVVVNPQPASTFSNTYTIENYASTFTPTVSGQSYAWTFASGSPASSNAQNPQITWTTAGSYQVDLTVTDGNNCSSTTQQNVTVSSCFANDPNSDFSWGAAIANYATAFTPDVSGAASYNWSFDNGNPATSTQQNPSITWSSAGTYAVTLTVSTGSACYTTTQNVTVSNCQTNQPESDFSWTMPAVANSNITFTPDDMGADTYTWTFDQATPNSSSTQSPNNIQWTNGGTYDVTLVTDFSGVGCFTTTKQVTVFGNMLTFTNCTQTGRTGPSQGQCNSAYTSTSLDGLVTVPNDAGIQEWTVPQTGTYRIEVSGAEAANPSSFSPGGKGATLSGHFTLTQGQVIQIMVGQQGTWGSSQGSGAGGGSFVVNQNNNPIIIAGGGGGGGQLSNGPGNGRDGRTFTSGGNGSGGSGGTNGSGGSGGSYTSDGSGLNGDGGNSQSFVNGGVGGCYSSCSSYGQGGFGGGGGGAHMGGGGGGYSGGGGGSTWSWGGGGGSYIDPSATNVSTSDGNYDGSPTFNGNSITNLNSYNSGHGQVIIYY